jgi:hypothetical protein
MIDFELEGLRYDASSFERLNPATSYLQRVAVKGDAPAESILRIYGVDAAEQYSMWQADAQDYAKPGLQLAVFTNELASRTHPQRELHLYAPRESPVIYTSRTQKGQAHPPAYLDLKQTIGTMFHFAVDIGDKHQEMRNIAVDSQLGAKLASLLIHQARTSPTDQHGNTWPKGPKHDMHIRGVHTYETAPSRTDPHIALARPRGIEQITPDYTRGIHELLKMMVRVMKQNQSKTQAEEGYVTRVSSRISTDIIRLAGSDYTAIAGSNDKIPPLSVLQDLIEATKFGAGWVANRKALPTQMRD